MTVFSFDTETHLIRPGLGAPPMVCLQFSVDGATPELVHARDPGLRRIVEWALSSATINGHNLAFDAVVLAAWAPDLIPLIFRCYQEDRATCTAVRQKLLDIARGWFEGRPGRTWGYSLAETAQRLTDGTYGLAPWPTPIVLDKTDPWRLRYGTLYGTPPEAWPPEARAYALTDASTQAAVYMAQDELAAVNGGAYLRDQYRQSRAAFWLRLMEVWGIRTDPTQVEKYRLETLADSERDRAIATAAGLVRPDGTRDTKRAMASVVGALWALGEEIPLTDKGEEVRVDLAKKERRTVAPEEIWSLYPGQYVKVDEDTCLASGDETLLAYQRFGSLKTTLSRVERLRMGYTLPLQASFQSIVETGRTSCRMGDVEDGESPPAWGFQLQNLPRKEGMRECFIPRPGFVFCSVDYDGMELRTWSQVCLWAVGHSRMAQVLNDGKDPHTELGARIHHVHKAEAYALRKAKDKGFDLSRQSAKIANFGYPGGMGPKTLRLQARKEYRVNMSLEEATALREAWREEWEPREYFDWVNGQLSGPRDDQKGLARHFLSDRYRGEIPYTVFCNTLFQGLAADAAKAAGWALARECYADPSSPLYGCRIVNFIHDEFLLEVPDHPERAHLAAYRQRDVMVSEAQRWLPDVKVTAEPALMRRWSKNAATVVRDGLLVPWEDAA